MASPKLKIQIDLETLECSNLLDLQQFRAFFSETENPKQVKYFNQNTGDVATFTIGTRNMPRLLWLWTAVLVAVVVPAARGLWVDLPINSGHKCLSEEIQNNVVVLADYYAFYGGDYDSNSTTYPTISVKVTSPYGNVVHHEEKVSHGQFGFTTTEAGNYWACFSANGDSLNGKTMTVGIDWKIGIAAKDWESVAKKEKIEGLELELKKLEANVEAIHQNLYNMMYRELEMKRVSDTTNARVRKYSIMSLGVCILVSIMQLGYLRRYFRNKKLI